MNEKNYKLKQIYNSLEHCEDIAKSLEDYGLAESIFAVRVSVGNSIDEDENWTD